MYLQSSLLNFLAEMEVLPWNFLCKGQYQIMSESRKKSKEAIPQDTVQSVIEFYNRGGIAREMLNARMVPKKTMIPNKVLECCIQSVSVIQIGKHQWKLVS